MDILYLVWCNLGTYGYKTCGGNDRIKQKILSLVFTLYVLTTFWVISPTASAAYSDIYTYTVSDGKATITACYQGKVLSYAEPITKLEEQNIYYFLPVGAYTSAKIMVLDSLDNLCPVIETTPVE